ncbi:hypothetical protein [Helicobacter sp. UBA3407]|nr:hypothetical protein [Helicobacter sp. UBA3407]
MTLQGMKQRSSWVSLGKNHATHAHTCKSKEFRLKETQGFYDSLWNLTKV